MARRTRKRRSPASRLPRRGAAFDPAIHDEDAAASDLAMRVERAGTWSVAVSFPFDRETFHETTEHVRAAGRKVAGCENVGSGAGLGMRDVDFECRDVRAARALAAKVRALKVRGLRVHGSTDEVVRTGSGKASIRSVTSRLTAR